MACGRSAQRHAVCHFELIRIHGLPSSVGCDSTNDSQPSIRNARSCEPLNTGCGSATADESSSGALLLDMGCAVQPKAGSATNEPHPIKNDLRPGICSLL